VREVALIERAPQPGAEHLGPPAVFWRQQVESIVNGDFFQLACASRDLFPELAQR